MRIESDAHFLSRFQSMVTGVTKIDTSVGIEFKPGLFTPENVHWLNLAAKQIILDSTQDQR